MVTVKTRLPKTRRRPPMEAFYERVAAGPNGCWIWTGYVDPTTGYGMMPIYHPSGRNAHRFAYTELVGPIPDGPWIDHLCRVRRCCNPAHLEPVTPQVNTLRSPIAVASRHAARTHCLHGHEMTPENTMWQPRRDNPEKKYRNCRTCRRNRERAASARRAAAKRAEG